MALSISTQQAGIAIIEALMAILIFSIGILAMVAMQSVAVSNVSDAKYRNTAAFLADEMVGTMWASRINATAANASNVVMATPDPTFACSPCTANNGNAYTQAWAASGVVSLPRGASSIAISGATVTVSLGWTTPKDQAQHHHAVTTVIN